MRRRDAIPRSGQAQRPTQPNLAVRLAAICSVVLGLSGCATYSDSFDLIQRNLAERQYDAALKNLEQQSGSKTDRVLYLLNQGMVLRMKGDLIASNRALEAAKQEMERLYAASVSEHTLSFLINDATVSYGGEDYEQVLVHLYLALNYLELGQADEARVEAQQVDIKLREIGETVSGGNFTEDAFSRYLTGLIYESNSEWSDAMISYRQAYEAYKQYRAKYQLPLPDMLKHDLLRLSRRSGLKNEMARYQKEFGITSPADDGASQQGELVFILNNGLAPIKREHAVTNIDPMSGVLVRIALPYYESRPNDVNGARIRADDRAAEAEMVEDIDTIARQSLSSHMPMIVTRSIARAIAKDAAVRAAARSNGGNRDSAAAAALLGTLAMQVTSLATERADTRSWLTLPANILMARLPLPAGEHTIKVELLGQDGQVVASREYPGITITAGRKTFMTQHWIPPQMPITRREP